MPPIETIFTILLIVFLLFLVIGGVSIYFMVKLGKKAAKSAKKATTRLTAHVNAMGSGEAAEVERLRLDLRREVSLTRQALDQAAASGWGLGDLPHLTAELAQQAEVQDQQLGLYAQQRRISSVVDHVTADRLREHQAKLTAMCARIRADVMRAQVQHASGGIDDLSSRTDLEIEARRPAPFADPLDEIDELYRKTMQNRQDPA
ncbi:hypothetical protein [Nonomuraea typhae]|uniref:Uncharacterized protein n=1 Tax=Nonomuraea typhae TaxID=2603600 RepID=A0ABW7YPE7_9ACTN